MAYFKIFIAVTVVTVFRFPGHDCEITTNVSNPEVSRIQFSENTSKVLNYFETERFRFGMFQTCLRRHGIEGSKLIGRFSNFTGYYTVLSFLQWNKYFPKIQPIAIFFPSFVTDVQASTRCGSQLKIPLVPNSGGHSYAGLSLGNDDSIIIDFRNMNSIDINEVESSVTVGPGALLGPINVKLWRNGRYGTPLGNCMTVAMGGHAIGGGVGYWSDNFGLVIDNVVEFEMVDAQGELIKVNKYSHYDLWWALRGIGPGYIGLITKIKLKIFKVAEMSLTVARVQYPMTAFPFVMEPLFEWLNWVKRNDPTVKSVMFVVSDNYSVPYQSLSPGIELQLLHIEDPKIPIRNGSEAFLSAISAIFPNPRNVIINYPSYIEFLMATAYLPVNSNADGKFDAKNYRVTVNVTAQLEKLDFVSNLTKEMSIPRYFFAKSMFVDKEFRAEDLLKLEPIMRELPENTVGLMITSEGGKVSAIDSNETSYIHRNSLLNLRVHFESRNIEDVIPGKAWINKFWRAIRFMDSGRTYQNFPDIELKDYLDRYYGENLYKLIHVKRKWDPNGYFNTTQSIPVNL